MFSISLCFILGMFGSDKTQNTCHGGRIVHPSDMANSGGSTLSNTCRRRRQPQNCRSQCSGLASLLRHPSTTRRSMKLLFCVVTLGAVSVVSICGEQAKRSEIKIKRKQNQAEICFYSRKLRMYCVAIEKLRNRRYSITHDEKVRPIHCCGTRRRLQSTFRLSASAQ